MKKLLYAVCYLFITLSTFSSQAKVIDIVVNSAFLSPQETLTMAISENFGREKRDVYIAYTLPNNKKIFFLTKTGITTKTEPYFKEINHIAEEDKQIISITMQSNLPSGKYQVFAAYTKPNSNIILGNIESKSFIFNGQGNKIFSVGENGTFQGCIGLQIALDLVGDLEEIRIQQGIYNNCTKLILNETKNFANGIKISGGWDANFTNQISNADLTILDANNKETILAIRNSTGTVKIEDLTFRNGNNPNINSSTGVSPDITDAGAIDGRLCPKDFIFNNTVYISIHNSRFINNQSDSAGAVIFCSGMVSHSFFSGNRSRDDLAGAVSINSWGHIINSVFIENKSRWSAGAVSGADMIINSDFTGNVSEKSSAGAVGNSDQIIASRFIGNSSLESGGGAISNSSRIISSFFENNRAAIGGAVFKSFRVINSVFYNNEASSDGGAVANVNKVFNSLFYNNKARNGGAIYSDNSEFLLINSTLYNNTAQEGGGFYGEGNILNSIFWENKLTDNRLNDISRKQSTQFNRNNTKVDYSLVNHISGEVQIGQHIIQGDPLFIDANNNDFHLNNGSAAINAGDKSVFEQNIDLDGKPRVINDQIDMGAFEFQ